MIAENLQQVMDWPAVLSPSDLSTEIPPVFCGGEVSFRAGQIASRTAFFRGHHP